MGKLSNAGSVRYERRGHVALITLDRPGARNALTPEMVCQLVDAWEEVGADAEVRVAVVTGSGDAFCAGADLGRLIPLFTGRRPPEDDHDRRIMSGTRVFDRAVLRVRELDKPIIAAVNGIAVAGGCELVQGTDLRVAATTARFGQQEVRWGLVPGGGAALGLPSQLPHAVAMEWLLTGALFDADRALSWGFVNRVVPAEAVVAEALALAETIAANGPLAVQAVRASMRACADLPADEALEVWRVISDRVLASDDAAEGPRAFVEKRPPRFIGR